MMGKKFGNIALSGVVSFFGISAVQAAVPVSQEFLPSPGTAASGLLRGCLTSLLICK